GFLSPESAAQDVIDIELFDDYELADSIASITGKKPEAADELTMYLLIIMDGLGTEMPEQVRRALERSVEFAFQFTETYHGALELYTLGQRGYLTGHLSAKELIQELIRNRVQVTGDRV
ncbi:MAG: hypothetical protein ACREAC_31475, partial [Blastocatellia bacterium]